MGLNIDRSLRDGVNILFGHALMAWGRTRRKPHLPDLLPMKNLSEGMAKCVVVLAVMDRGRMVQFGGIVYGGCI
ncbi:putative centromere DNA-binding protein complex CBF3 subunit domain-containing protein [Phytophthora infestans]|uniref:Putative centromere DNA-binding protein complex CBF3 subunit domain-containing protein n=1 Tax=Phytophthora infestans TaxID=4787 RepID=A0A8S9TPU5_PHYIN|nr:putative centromere DNA-binding protein complex CBF3 subunit domain-containing protein [Phytophthora infestans]